MISKILKAELFALFLLTVFAFCAFYYKESMPDNYLSISSSSESLSYISYYLTSFIVWIGYYTGPWLFVPFIVYALLYSFFFSKRDFYLDAANAVSLSLFVMFTTFLSAPEFLGEGLALFLKGTIDFWTAVGLSFSFLMVFLAGSFREDFKTSMIKTFEFIKTLPTRISTFISKFRLNDALKKGSMLTREKMQKANLKLASGLKSAKKENENDQMGSFQASLVNVPAVVENEPAKEVLRKPTPLKAEPGAKDVEENYEQQDLKANLKDAMAKEDPRYHQLVTEFDWEGKREVASHPDNAYFQEIISRLEDKLTEFRIDGRIINILKGPVVDTFELELGAGVQVSKVNKRQEDLSLALFGAPIRIVYPMKGRSTIGIEVPRNPREIIYLDQVFESEEFTNSRHRLPIGMGKDSFGEVFVADLASMPHMLVAGATGAGKSVFINSLLVSLLVKKSPAQMKLILIDPKQLELALYANLPHLLMPVVVDAPTASISLLWAVQEMERRYSILKEFGVRNISGFNEKLKVADSEMLANIHRFYEDQPDDNYELPYIVIVVDEYADLVLTKSGKEIETNISRLAAKARAAGIHLVVATQRPSVDVITGVIKSNFPTRVSFKVTTGKDSSTILDRYGAEKLLGKGDMLFKQGVETIRVHSSFVDENEIETLTSKLSTMDNSFHPGAMDFLENGGPDELAPGAVSVTVGGMGGTGKDDLYKDAVRTVIEHKTASASMLQRRLRIGYNRAANLVEQMEADGVVGPANGAKGRDVLIASMDEI